MPKNVSFNSKSNDSILREKWKEKMDGKYQERSCKTQKIQRKNLKLRNWVAKKTKQANAQMPTPQPNAENSSATSNSIPNSISSFSCQQTLYCSPARANLH